MSSCLSKTEVENQLGDDLIKLEHFGEFIQNAGVRLELPETTIATAVHYFQRFFSVEKFAAHDPYLIARTCLFAAAKNEETPRKMRDVINTTYVVQYPDRPPIAIGSEYWKMKDALSRSEMVLLRSLKFELDVTLPQQFVLFVCKHLHLSKEMSKVAWCITNDSLRTPAMLLYPPHAVACACVHLALSLLPHAHNPRTDSQEWWLDCDTSRAQVEDICHMLISVYERGSVCSADQEPLQFSAALSRIPPPSPLKAVFNQPLRSPYLSTASFTPNYSPMHTLQTVAMSPSGLAHTPLAGPHAQSHSGPQQSASGPSRDRNHAVDTGSFEADESGFMRPRPPARYAPRSPTWAPEQRSVYAPRSPTYMADTVNKPNESSTTGFEATDKSTHTNVTTDDNTSTQFDTDSQAHVGITTSGHTSTQRDTADNSTYISVSSSDRPSTMYDMSAEPNSYSTGATSYTSTAEGRTSSGFNDSNSDISSSQSTSSSSDTSSDTSNETQTFHNFQSSHTSSLPGKPPDQSISTSSRESCNLVRSGAEQSTSSQGGRNPRRWQESSLYQFQVEYNRTSSTANNVPVDPDYDTKVPTSDSQHVVQNGVDGIGKYEVASR
eukprot:944857_1